ncbi:hypothetical protein CALVIDRAFT_537633 [Calocera viscosa TUFC12733]|uniref:Transmembrane protein n=1 Tax=Calocera viscosa (strain TUFC12733) TaxID=1330018 RepID=A0A167LUP0_CALVF|nr:hypothetical protein CALVIDRAFT_537633 [Calocera viscosa TUFC12733]
MAAPYSYQVTIADTSPLLAWNGAWAQCFDQSGCTPPAAGASGVGESYHGTNVSGPSVSLTFVGDAIQLYGDYAAGSGGTVTVDNSTVSPSSSPGTDLNSLFATDSSLSNDSQHTVSLQTTAPFNFTSAIVSVTSTQPLSNYSLPYGNPAIVYSGTWSTVTVQGLAGGTTRTNQVGASASVNFTGVGVIVYSSMNSGHGPYNVTLDGETTQYTAVGRTWLVPETIIYYAAHLTPGTHTLVLTNNGAGGSTTFTLNRITVVQLASEAGPSSTATSETSTGSAGATSTSPPLPSAVGNTNNGAIAGGVVGGAAALVLLIFLVWFFMRRGRATPVMVPFVTPRAPASLVDDEEKTAENIPPPPPPPQLSQKRSLPSSRSVPVLPIAATAPTTSSAETTTSPSALSPIAPKPEATAVSEALATAGVGNNSSGTLLRDSDAANEVVDRVLELLAGRIDPHRPGEDVSGGSLPPPVYRDTR